MSNGLIRVGPSQTYKMYSQMLRHTFNPHKTLAYFVDYINLTNEFILNRSGIMPKIRLLNLLIVLKGVHFIYLALQPHLDPLDRALHFDAFYLLMPKPTINLGTILCVAMTIYCNVILVLTPDRKLNSILWALLIREDCSMFLHPTVMKNGRHKNVCDCVRKYFLLMLNIFLGLLLSGGKSIHQWN